MRPWNLFNVIEIKRSSDVAAFVALFLSIFAVISSFWIWTQGPSAEVVSPKSIVFAESSCFLQPRCLLVISDMIYLNYGDPGYDDFIMQENITIKVGNPIEGDGLMRQFNATAYVKTKDPFIRSASHCTDTSDDKNCNKQLDWDELSESYPRSISSGAVEAHETLFSSPADPVSFELFEKLVSDSSNGILVRYEILFHRSRRVKIDCTIDPTILRWVGGPKQWTSAPLNCRKA